MEYEREFIRLSRHVRDMFQTKKALCDKFEWRLRDEIRTLVSASEVLSLAVMIAKAHKMEIIVHNRSQDKERMTGEHKNVELVPIVSFKKPMDVRNFSYESIKKSQVLKSQGDSDNY